MKKQTFPYIATYANDDTSRALMVHEIKGQVLPNALQNAVVEAAKAVSDIAYDLKSVDSEFVDLLENLIGSHPVLATKCSLEASSEIALKTLHMLHKLRFSLLATRTRQKAEALRPKSTQI